MPRKAIEAFRRAASEKPTALARKLCRELTERVVTRTPVDTGEARGGWLPGLNTIRVDEESGRLDPTGAAVLLEAETVLAQMTPGDEYSLANSVKHIGLLEYGSSQQAPAGMLRVTVAEAPSIWREIVQGQR